MRWFELKKILKENILLKGLKSPQIRLHALENIDNFIVRFPDLVNNIELLSSQSKNKFEVSYSKIKKEKNINGAERSIINNIYNLIYGKSSNKEKSTLNKKDGHINTPINNPKSNFEDAFTPSNFHRILSIKKHELKYNGFYIIRLRDKSALPQKYHQYIQPNQLLYIGKAENQNLYKRFFKQELKGIGHGTFFRSIGAVLGYRPEKGSLYHKKNKNNYIFNSTDKKKITEWLSENVEVNWIIYNGDFSVEKALIKKYLPIFNSIHNPNKLIELEKDKNECRMIARNTL